MREQENLVAWLGKQLDEEEKIARDAVYEEARSWRAETGNGGCSQIRDSRGGVIVYGEGSLYDEEAAHIVRHDPASVLADIAAKRQIIDRCAEVLRSASDHHTVESCDEDDVVLAEAVIGLLVSAYAPRSGM